MKEHFKAIMVLLLPLVLLLIYAMMGSHFTIDVQKIDVASASQWFHERDSAIISTLTDAPVDTVATPEPSVATPDTTPQRILLIGDSMVERLGPHMARYAAANGHELTTVCWYSSSSKTWALSDTLQHFMRESRPTLVAITLGGNEQFVRDLPQRETYIKYLLDLVRNVPHIWICTPAWTKDTGYNDLALRLFGEKCFFDSRSLSIPRATDHIHLSKIGAGIWMDSIATWMSSPRSLHPIKMDVPAADVRTSYKPYYLSPQE